MRDFESKGWEIINLRLDDKSISEILNDCHGHFSEGEKYNNQNNRVQDAWRMSEAVRKLALHPELMGTVQECLGGKAFAFQTLNFCKGTQQELHSDYYHFGSRDTNGMCGVWVALEDANENNGALSVVTGSHRDPILFPEDLNIPVAKKNNPYEFYELYEEKIRNRVNSLGHKTETIFIEKGQAVIWHSNLIHGGSKIKDSNSTRYSQVTHYFKSGSAYFTPVNSKRGAFSKSYRVPFDVSTGRRAYRSLGLNSYFLDILGF